MKKNFVEILLKNKVITPDQMHIALIEQKKENKLLGDILIDLNFANPKTIGEIQSIHSGYPFVDLEETTINQELINKIGTDTCAKHLILPFNIDEYLHVAMSDPENVVTQDFIKSKTKEIFKKFLKCKFYYSNSKAIQNAISQAITPDLKEHDAPFEKIFNSLFRNAILETSSDIHFIPHEKMVEIKLRCSGSLENYTCLEWDIYNKFAVKLKILSKLDIAEKREPQSGGCTLKFDENKIDCRVSFHPTLWGESLVVRLLNTNRKSLKLEELGFLEKQIKELKNVLRNPFGLFLVSGATGSGKTTTLHALLQEIDTKSLNVMTLEQPIEYRVKGIRQTEIQEDTSISFADGIRSILRHDPDVLLIGEIRDEDTAKMALRAAMTGHLVLATIHSSNAYTAPARLIDLGISEKLLAGQIIGVLDQKLEKKENSKKRYAKGELVIFNDEMHKIVSEGASPHLLKNNSSAIL